MEENEAQIALPEVEKADEDRTPLKIFQTGQFIIKVPEDTLEKFMEKLDAEKKNGKPKFTESEKQTFRLMWVQQKMKPSIKDDITGDQYYQGKCALFKAVFGFDL